jgi:hypothetical protein
LALQPSGVDSQTFEKAVASLAILKVNLDRGHDYIENFVPFVVEAARSTSQTVVSLSELQESIRESFGFNIPYGALRTILNRTVRRGYLLQQDRVYRLNDTVLSSTPHLTGAREQVQRQFEALLDKLAAFCLERYSTPWSRTEAEAALLAYLQARSAAVLSLVIPGAVHRPALKSVKRADFLVNAFIMHLNEREPEGFAFLEAIVKGSMLADALYFPDLGSIDQRFSRIAVYFDTPILLRALGFAGPGLQVPYRELISLLNALNAPLRCFQHTFDEIYGILDAASRALRDPSRHRTTSFESLEFFLAGNLRPSDVELLIGSLETKLRGLGVLVMPSPKYTPELGVDEPKLATYLREEVHYRSEEALSHDLDSLTGIYRLRRGKSVPRIETCGAIFVTSNGSLVRASNRFFWEEDGQASGCIPVSILDHVFTTIVWLKKPLIAPDLPKNQIIADCFAALNPPDELWKKYLEEINRLERQGEVSTENYHVLRYSSSARMALMDATLGDSEAFAEGTVEEVLAAAQSAIRQDAEAVAAKSIRQLEEEQARRQEADQKAASAEAAAERASANAKAQTQANLDAQRRRFEVVANSIGRAVSRGIFGLTVLLLAYATYLTIEGVLPPSFPALPRPWKDAVASVAVIGVLLFGALGLLHLSVGITLWDVLARVEFIIARRAEHILVRIFEPTPKPELPNES